MELTEAKIYEAFGLEAPAADAGTGEQVQEVAAPADTAVQTGHEEGEREQEIAAPASGDDGQDPETASTEDGDGGGDTGSTGQSTGKEPMTPEQRRENAAKRRQQEQKAAVDQAVAEALQAEREKSARDLEQFFVRMGMKNTYTGEQIKTMDQFNSWKQQFDAEQLDKDLKAGKATAEQLQQMISNHPVVQQAQQVIEQTQREQQAQQAAADQARIDDQLAQIQKLNPQIKSVADLLTMPKADTFKEFVAKGNDFISAYRLTFFEELTDRKAEAAKQQAINNSRGKDHLQAVGGARGSGALTVPAREMAMYRAFNPNATEAEIQAHYNKYKKT